MILYFKNDSYIFFFILGLTTLCISCYYFECKSNHFAESFAPCKLELEETVSKKRVEFAVNTRKRRNIERGLTDRNYPGSSWKPKGALIAHLHEHKVISKPRELCRYRIFFWGHSSLLLQVLLPKSGTWVFFWIYAFFLIKIQIFWGGHKAWKKSSNLFDNTK